MERIREEALRQSHSFKISSGAQGVMKQSMKLVWDCVIKELWKDGVWVEPLLQVHDEILLEFQEDLAEVLDPWVTGIMCNTVELRVPIRAKGGTGQSWAQLEK